MLLEVLGSGIVFLRMDWGRANLELWSSGGKGAPREEAGTRRSGDQRYDGGENLPGPSVGFRRFLQDSLARTCGGIHRDRVRIGDIG
jgi:hypothetical protein